MTDPAARLRRLRPFLPVLFAVTGAAGLVYEVVWFKLLDAIFGVTALATSTVLAVFMGGLGLGAALAARRADRWERPLFAYGVLETSLGAFAALVPFLLPLVNRLFVGLYDATHPSLFALSLLRAFVCALVLLPPATLMGMTLPVIARAFSRDETAAPDVGLLYTINTLGATVGAAVGGFLLLPAFGLRATSAVAVGLNLCVGICAMALGRSLRQVPVAGEGAAARETTTPASDAPSRASSASAHDPASGRPARLLLAISALSGLTSLGYQVFWTRALVLSFGNTVYAFTVSLVTVLIGITLGGALATAMLRRTRRPTRALAVTQGLAAVAVVLMLFAFRALPERYAALSVAWSGTFAGYVGAALLMGLSVLLPATILLGMGLPLVLGVAIDGARELAREVGSLYSLNTWGAILGSLAAGFLALPALGIHGGVLLFAALNAVAAALALLLATPGARARIAGIVALAAALGAAAAVAPGWDPDASTRSAFGRRASIAAPTADDEIAYYRDGVVATVTVRRRGSNVQLQSDGRTEATNGDLKTNTMLGSLPVTLHPRPESVLVIGLGSGVTLAGVLQHPVRSVDCVELSAEIVEAARFFDRWLDGALGDPRVTMRASDGRNHLLLTGSTYDVIVSQPSNLWAAGVGSLFTREFFELSKDHLTDDGILCQWLQGYSVSEESLRSILRTITDVYPSVDVWVAEWSDILVLASKSRRPIDVARLESVFADQRAGGGFARAGVPDVPTLLSHFMLDDETVRRFSRGAPLHTDDDRRVELHEPQSIARGRVTQQSRTLLAWQSDVRGRLAGWPPAGADSAAAEARLSGAVEARRDEMAARAMESEGRGREAVAGMEAALIANPQDGAIRRNLAELHVRIGVDLARAGNLQGAFDNFRDATLADPSSAEAWANVGRAEHLAGRRDAALDATEQARALDPDDDRFAVQEGDFLRNARRFDDALRAYEAALALRPSNRHALTGQAECLLAQGRTDDAMRVLDDARRAGADEAELVRIGKSLPAAKSVSGP